MNDAPRPLPPATFGEEFLEWVRDHSALPWASDLSDADIDDIEAAYAVRFPPDYRLFLRVLHAPAGTPPGASFYDWRHHEEAIREAFDGPLEGLAFDAERNTLWADAWGERPGDSQALRETLRALLRAKAAPLIPVYGHRCLVGAPLRAGNPVLSIHQTDIITYGDDLRGYLLHELFGEAGPCAGGQPILPRWREIPFWGDFVS
jgi:hypothetical protein